MPIRVAVVGCGLISQVAHLPNVAYQVPGLELAALVEPVASVAARVSQRFGVRRIYRRLEDLLAEDDVDAVVIASPSEWHGQQTLAALSAGKHVLVEKPMCFTLREARAIEEAARASGRVVLVGFMRRYDPAYRWAQEEIAAWPQVLLAEVSSHAGRWNEIGWDREVDRVAPSGEAEEVLQTLRRELVREGAGSESWAQDVYLRLLLFWCHDLSALRGLVGNPIEVAGAWTAPNTLHLSLRLPAGGLGSFAATFHERSDWSPSLLVHDPQHRLHLVYPNTPYIKRLPTELEVRSPDASREYLTCRRYRSLADPYVEELQAWRDAIDGRSPVPTDPTDFVWELKLYQDILAALRRTQAAS